MRLRSLRWHWNTLGRRDPLNAILTRTAQDSRWNLDEFFETGRGDVSALLAEAGRLVPELGRRRALDFGCGIGRLTRALADHFEEVVGIDIAESMIAAAKAHNTHLARCRFELNVKTDLRQFSSGTFDVVLAWIVLQHMPPPLMRQYIPELLRVLTPGGLLVFQLPTEAVDSQKAFCEAPVVGGRLKHSMPLALVHAYRWGRFQLYRQFVPHMEMYGMAREVVVALVESCAGRILDVRPNQSHGPATPGFSYWVTREARGERREARGGRRERETRLTYRTGRPRNVAQGFSPAGAGDRSPLIYSCTPRPRLGVP